jgi:hypothetical protein
MSSMPRFGDMQGEHRLCGDPWETGVNKELFPPQGDTKFVITGETTGSIMRE